MPISGFLTSRNLKLPPPQLLSFAHVALDDERLELAQQFLNEARKVALRAKDKGVNAEVQQPKSWWRCSHPNGNWLSLRSIHWKAIPWMPLPTRKWAVSIAWQWASGTEDYRG
ncbi:MAG: hypothetical protein ACYC3X_07735 [Pirellulaceae bacterium]